MSKAPCPTRKNYGLCLDGRALVISGRWRFASAERATKIAALYPPIPGAVVCEVDSKGRAIGGGR